MVVAPTYVPASGTRLIRGALTSASRCPAVFSKPRTSRLSPAQANGVRFENKVHKALAILAKSLNARVERNPWFRFIDSNGPGACSPDAILWLNPVLALIVEVKYTWTPVAAPKLRGLYIPVVNLALKPPIIRSLIVCKNLTPDSPRPISRICEGTQFTAREPSVYQWLGQGPLLW